MSDLDTLLTQALALVNEDQRGQLADVIEQIVNRPVRTWLRLLTTRPPFGTMSA